MAVTYNTVELLEGPYSWPAWETTWYGTGGCSNVLHFMGARSLSPATNQVQWYEPESIQEKTDTRHIKGRRPGYPPYRFTPYSVSRTTTREHLLRRQNGSNGYTLYYQYGGNLLTGGACVQTPSHVDVIGPCACVWNDVTRAFPYTEYQVSAFDAAEVTQAIAKATNEAALDALTSYDVLTDIAEARELPGLVRDITKSVRTALVGLTGRFSLKDLRMASRITPQQLLKHPYKTLRAIGGKWMEYRYGLMPLVYSYRDAIKTMAHGPVMTTRKSIVVVPKSLGTTLPGPTSKYLWTEYDGDCKISATVFQYFSRDSVAQLAGLGLNPLTTAWELIPYSFVVDWFVNVGDYITRKTSSAFSRCHWACVSKRSNYTKKTWAHYPKDDKTITFGRQLSTVWIGDQPPTSPSRTISRPEESQLYNSVEVQSYDRWLFALNDANLIVSPSMNWKRFCDSAVLILNQLASFNRRLKG